MIDEWTEGSYWKAETGQLIRIKGINGSEVHFCSVEEPVIVYKTSKLVFKLFYSKLDPSEEGLMLLSRLDK